MANDFAAVVNQLKENNASATARDAEIIINQKQGNTILADKLGGLNDELISKLTNLRDGIEESFGLKKEVDATKASDEKEKDNKQNRFMNALMKTNEKISSTLSGFTKSIMDSAKSKAKDLFGIFKKFAMVGALGALLAFLNSELFVTLKEKFLDPITESFKKLFERLKAIPDAFDKVKKNFYNEETGEFEFIEGLKKTFEDIKGIFSDIGIALAVVTGLVFRKKILAAAGRAAGGMTRLLGSLVGFNTEVDKSSKSMKNQIDKSKKTGVFRRGLQGIGGKFRGLFRIVGRFGGLLGGVAIAMASNVDFAKVGGVLSDTAKGIGSKFKSMFTAVGDFGKGIADRAGKMATSVGTSMKNGLLSAKGKIMGGFDKMFGALGDFASGLKNLATKAANKVKKTISATGDDIDGKKTTPKRPEEIRREKQLQAQNDPELKKKQAANLERMRKEKLKAQMDLFKKADAESMKNFKAAQKAAKEAAEKAAKEAAESATKEVTEKTSKEAAELIAKSTAKAGIKKIPIVSIGAGLIFGFQRALQGDFTGAGLEVTSGILGTFPGLGTAGSVGIDAGLLASDLGALDKLKGKEYPIDGVVTPSKTATDGVGVTPDPSRGGGGMMIMPNIVTTNNPQSYVEQNISAVPITNFAKPRGVGISLVQ